MENTHTVTLPRTEIERMESELARLRAVEAAKTLYIQVGGKEQSYTYSGREWGEREFFNRSLICKRFVVESTLDFGEKWKEIKPKVIELVNDVTKANLASLDKLKEMSEGISQESHILTKLMNDLQAKIKAFNNHVSKSWWLRKWYFDGKE